MATVVNDADVLIMATVPRFTPPTDRGMFLTPPAAIFKLSANGLSASPSQFVFKATLLNLDGVVSFTWTGGMTFAVSGNQATLDFANMSAVSGTLTANITVDGVPYTQIATVTKLADGAAGQDGPRGTVDISAATSGSIWSNAEATAAIASAGFGTARARDIVSLYRSDRTWAERRLFDGTNWTVLGEVVNGALFVKGSVLADAIDARGFDIKDMAGNIILQAGQTLAQQTKTGVNLVPRPSDWPAGSQYSGAYVAYNYANPNSTNGQFIVLPVTPNAAYVGFESASIGIPVDTYYTVSFDGQCDGTRNVCVDIYGSGVDTTGKIVALTTTWQHFTFTEILPSSGCTDAQARAARLRVFATAPTSGSLAYVANVKVELGPVATAWTDDTITATNATQRVMPNSLNQTMFGGDLSSTNWNGRTDALGQGWLLQRTGILYCANIRARGFVASGAYNGYAWPANGAGGGSYIGPEGLLLGNPNEGNKYFQVESSGNIYAPGLKLVNGQLTLTSPIIITPQVVTTFAISIPSINVRGQPNTGSYQSFGAMSASQVNGVGPFKYLWTFSTDGGDIKMVGDPTQSTVQIQARGVNTFCNAYLSLTVTDSNGAQASSSSNLQVQFGSGIQQ